MKMVVGFVTVVILANFATISLAIAGQGNLGNPRILPPHSSAYGKTYGAWSAEWWKWAFKLPTDNHPLFNTSDCSAGQSGEVWFLGGTMISNLDESGRTFGQAERNCTIPSGTVLFFPILNSEADIVGMDPLPSEEYLKELAKNWQDHAVFLEYTIDGRPVLGLSDPIYTPYRVQSPVFSFTLPEEKNFYQYYGYTDIGLISPAVADGVFVMVAPLSVGEHTIHFSGEAVYTQDQDGFDLDFFLDITYHITVQPE